MNLYARGFRSLCLCVGPEVAYLMRAELSQSDGEESIDILERLNRLNVSFVIGVAYEPNVGNHIGMVSLLYFGGVFGLKGDDHHTR